MSFVLPGVVKIPRRNTFIEGAMQEPVNTVLKAVERLRLLRGDIVLVAGQGPIGLLFTKLLALRGMKVVASDLLPPRLTLAKQWGARWSLAADGKNFAEEVQKITRGRGLDAAVIAVPSDAAVLQAQGLLRGAGQLLLFAHTRRGSETSVDLSSVCVDEKDLLGSYSADFTLQQDVAKLVFSRRLDVRKLITHQFPLEKTSEAVELAAHPKPESLKIMVTEKGEK
jgi:L-iditol 2-dehydrogenase